MKKQTKVLLAAALFTLGASFSAFAYGETYDWKVEDGQYVCYDKDGKIYTECFVESLGTKYWVDEYGHLGQSEWIEYGEDNDLYYIQSDGSVTTNNWKYVLPVDAEDDDELGWYYFAPNGKLATEKRIAWKENYYYVDEFGKMLTGWIEYDKGVKCEAADDTWTVDELIYLNEDGTRASEAWVNSFVPGTTEDDWEELDEEDMNWYWIKDNGAVQTGRKKDIDGNTYFFDANDGHMLTGWVAETSEKVYEEIDTALNNYKDVNVFFCGDANEGWVKKDRWVLEYRPEEVADADEDTKTYWYLIDEDGYVYVPDTTTNSNAVTFNNGAGATLEEVYTIATANNAVQKLTYEKKDYLFNANGEMQYGLVKMADGIFYFGEKATGNLTTGEVVLEDAEEEEEYTLFFATDNKKGEAKGAIVTGLEGKVVYNFGVLQTAETDDDYRYVTTSKGSFIVDENGKAQTSTRVKYTFEDRTGEYKATFKDATGRSKNSVDSLLLQK